MHTSKRFIDCTKETRRARRDSEITALRREVDQLNEQVTILTMLLGRKQNAPSVKRT